MVRARARADGDAASARSQSIGSSTAVFMRRSLALSTMHTAQAELAHIETPRGVAAQMWRLAKEALGGAMDDAARRPLVVVDPAAGCGALCDAPLRDREVACRVVALEVDPSRVERLRAHLDGRATVVHMDTLELLWSVDGPRRTSTSWTGVPTPPVAATRYPDILGEAWADVVLCNPPYLRETGNARVFRELRALSPEAAALYRKDCDLHHFFWASAWRWLRPGGVAVFLAPAYMLDAASAQPLRERLTRHGDVVALWRAGRARLFPDVSVEAAITVWRRNDANAKLDAQIDPKDAPDAGTSTQVLRDLGERIDTASARAMVTLPRDGRRWSLAPLASVVAAGVGHPTRTLGATFRVVEGVATGADRVTRRNQARAPELRLGDGVLVLSSDEVGALGLAPDEAARFVRPRLGGSSYLLWLLDGDLPDLEESDTSPVIPDSSTRTPAGLHAHLLRCRGILTARAEMQRNPSRSWYALAWPRVGALEGGVLVTPKWSSTARFVSIPHGVVPGTDQRVLVPRHPMSQGEIDRWRRWLNGASMIPWWSTQLKRKGDMLEFYGVELLRAPAPP